MAATGDILLFDDGKRLFYLDINSVECVMEAEEVFFMPGIRPPVMGVVTYRGEPVAVVNVKEVSGGAETIEKPYVIIIAGDGGKTIGLCAGGKKPAVAHSGEVKISNEEERGDGRGLPSTTLGKVGVPTGHPSEGWVGMGRGEPIELLNWMDIYDKTRKILSRPASRRPL